MFKPRKLSFETMNEADVRAEVIEPLLLHLGYEAGTSNCIEREVHLRYPYDYCGRKKPGKDRLINKSADFVLKVNDYRAWTIEAKPPYEPIDDETIDQALSYANHPEVNVQVLMICNGRKIAIYQTRQGEYRKPFIDIDYEAVPSQLGELEAWLTPQAFAKKFPRIPIVQSSGLAPGFRREMLIVDGEFKMVKTNILNDRALRDLAPTVREGSVVLMDTGMLMRLKITSGQQPIEQQRKDWGFEWQELWSGESQLSRDPGKPTLFTSRFILPLEQGQKLYDISKRQYVESEKVDLEIVLVFLLFLEGETLRGIQRCWMQPMGGSPGTAAWFEAECWLKCARQNL